MSLTNASKQNTPSSQNVWSSELNLPRRCDTIARKSHSLFIWTVSSVFLLFILWATFMSIDKVKKGPGRIVPLTQNQFVQHLEGGIITEILVREGDKVQKDQALMRVENLFAKAELQQVELEIKTRKIKFARLDTEANNKTTLIIPAHLVKDLPRVAERETGLYTSRKNTLREQLHILDDQMIQKQSELAELKSRWENTQRERELIDKKVVSLRRLTAMGAVSSNELLENERSLQQVVSKLADILHTIPRVESTISEAKSRRSESESRYRGESSRERNDIEHEISKLEETYSALLDRSRRNEVIAPTAGTVNKIFLTTIGGVVKSGEQLVQIVPTDDKISIEARLAPTDRAEIWPGLPAVIKVSAYDYSIFGGLHGKIIDISPDALQDEKGLPYFRVRLEANTRDFGSDKPVLPGMMADVDIIAGKQTIMSILLKPVKRIREHAFRQ